MQRTGMFLLRFFTFCLLIILQTVFLSAQEYSLKNYTVDDGVPSPEVYSAIQDDEGYIWFGTDRGVCRFNGYSFETFTTAQGLSYNTVFQLHKDHKKRIWFLANNSRLSYYEKGVIKQHPANATLAKLFPNTYYSSFHYDTGDTIWLAVHNHGLIKITPQHKIIKVQDTSIHLIKVFDEKNFITSAGLDAKLYIQQPNTSAKEKVSGTELKFRDPIFLRTSADQFIFTHGPLSNLLSVIEHNKIKSNHTFDYRVVCALKVSKNEIWIGSRSQGVYCFANNNFVTPINRFLRNATITSMMKDREGNFWITTLEDGIYLLRTRNVVSYLALSKEDNNKYHALLNDGQYLWIGTDKGFTYRVDEKNTFIRYKQLGSPVTSIIKTNKNEIWIGSNSGLHIVNKNTLQFIDALPKMPRMYNSPNGNVWGSKHADLYIFKNNTWEYCQGQNARQHAFIDAMAEDKNGILWLACNDGVWQYDINKKTYTKLEAITERVIDIKITAEQSVWMACQGKGIILYKDGATTYFNEEAGLLSNLCNKIYIDDEHTIWVSTYKGLNSIEKKSGGNYEIKSITIKDGLISNEVYNCIKFHNKLWVFTGNGVSVFDPGKIKPDTYLPPVYITSVKINTKEFPTVSKYNLLHTQSNISINFAAIYFKNAGKVKYRYRMTGPDTSWSYTENTTVEFGALRPGNYLFQVSAQNNAGRWNPQLTSIDFTIQPAYWQRGWFWLMILAVIIIIGLISMRLRISQLIKRKNLIYQLEVYKNHALQARMNPHFIFNSLNSINNFILQNDKLNSSKYLSKFARLMRFILDNSAKTDIPLELELQGIELYLELEKQRFKDKLNYAIKISPEVNLLTTKIPALILQPFVENAILHGILPKDGPGNILIDIQKQDGKICCVIKDDGIGRKKAAQRNEERTTKHVSNGIDLTKQRLEILNRLYKGKTELEIIDLEDKDGNPSGTEVKLSWPIY